CTQLPTDVPNEVLSQLGARIQHALRAFTPDDQKALTKTVRTYPKTDVYDLASALTSLGIGEAVVTVLSERGAPTPVAWTRLRSPRSLMAAIGDSEIHKAAEASPLHATYSQTVDRESAYEKLQARKAQAAAADQPAEAGSKSAPAPAKKPGWFRRFVNSRGFQTFLRAVGTELIRSMFGGSGRRRR
ncbi:MAG TPA: helicase HerA-like domain-containing protein, partial [Mycobacterium sp.]